MTSPRVNFGSLEPGSEAWRTYASITSTPNELDEKYIFRIYSVFHGAITESTSTIRRLSE